MYFRLVCSRALKETRKLWTPQRTWVAFASPVVTVPIRGLVSGWSMHDLLTTAWITVLVVAALWTLTFLFDFIRSPALLHRQQQTTIEDQARSIQDLETRASGPVLSPQEEAKRQRVRNFIAGVPKAEMEVLQYILNSGDEIYSGTLYDAFGQSQRDLVASSLQRWEHKLVQRRIEHGTMKTYWFIVPGLRDALTHVLYEAHASI